jgi:hypothetical protein
VGGWEDYPEQTRPVNWDSDHDGLPDWWEALFALNPQSPTGDFGETNADPDGDGYTRLDDYLAWMARPRVECLVGKLVDVDLSVLTVGYTSGPIRVVSGASAGTVQMLPDGKTARFTPPAGFSGLATFNFTVTDSVGDNMTGTIGVLVTNAYTTPTKGTLKSVGGAMTLQFSAAAGAVSRLQHSLDLINWTEWQTITANGSVQSIPIPPLLQAGMKRFFRAQY